MEKKFPLLLRLRKGIDPGSSCSLSTSSSSSFQKIPQNGNGKRDEVGKQKKVILRGFRKDESSTNMPWSWANLFEREKIILPEFYPPDNYEQDKPNKATRVITKIDGQVSCKNIFFPDVPSFLFPT